MTPGEIRLPPARKAAAFGLALLAGLLAVEVFVRVAEPLLESRGPLRRPDIPPVFRFQPGNGGRFVSAGNPRVYSGQTFAAVKTPETLRIFCLGDSAAKGLPHDQPFSYPARLQAMLQEALPQRRVEVLNAAGNGFHTDATLQVFREIIEHAPDAVVVWAGNNDFRTGELLASYERLGPLRRSAAARLAARVLFPPDPMEQDRHGLGRYLVRRPSPLRTVPRLERRVRSNYEANLEAIAGECRRRGVPLLLATVPVNLKDWSPNVSTHRRGLSGSGRAAWLEKFREGVLAHERGDDAAAGAAFRAALEFDGGHADTHFRLGRALLRAGDRAGALRHFSAAAETDAYPFRAPPSLNEIAARVAREHGARLVDLVELFNAHAGGGIAGHDVFVDPVHPRPEMNVLVARAMFSALAGTDVAEGLRGRAPPSPPAVQGTARTPSVVNFLFRFHVVLHQYGQVRHLGEELKRIWDDAAAPGFDVHDYVERAVGAAEDFARLERAEMLGLEEFSKEEAEAVRSRFYGLGEAFSRFDSPENKPAGNVPN
jgi:lysophospholipase L1-like esterase